MRADEELPGVAALADRPVDGRRVAIVMGVVGLALAIGCGATLEQLLASANAEPDADRSLRALGVQHPAPSQPPGRVAVVLVDGMRVDEARRLPAWRALAPRSVTGEIALPTPTLSRPFYHLLLTGVPPDASGIRSNRFTDHARHDSLTDRVRERGGSVSFVAEGLDWLRRMHGRPGDGGSDARESIEPRALDAHLRAWRAKPAPALLVVHVTSTDATAHANGIDSAAHREALARADRVIERVAREEATLFVLSDHGHRAAGGHGGPEPEVARAPLLMRASGLSPAALAQPIRARSLAATLASWLGVPAPRSAIGAPAQALSPEAPTGGAHERLAALVERIRRQARAQLSERRRTVLPLALLASLMALGTIKRAYGFDRSTLPALFAWPALVVIAHVYALDRPLSFSAIDTRGVHGARVVVLGIGAALVAFALARALGRGEGKARTRRAAASVGWGAFVSALFACAWAGFALGPWPLSPLESYLPLLALGAGGAALATASALLFASAAADRVTANARPPTIEPP